MRSDIYQVLIERIDQHLTTDPLRTQSRSSDFMQLFLDADLTGRLCLGLLPSENGTAPITDSQKLRLCLFINCWLMVASFNGTVHLYFLPKLPSINNSILLTLHSQELSNFYSDIHYFGI